MVALVAVMIFWGMATNRSEAATVAFKDVPKEHPYYEVIQEMSKQGFIRGYEDGTFRPNDNITRRHAILLITRVPGVNLKQTTPVKKFNDITKKDPHYNSIMDFQRAGLFEADEKGNFNSNQLITRGEMADILYKAFEIPYKATDVFVDVPYENKHWFSIYSLYSYGITTGDNGYFYPEKALTRAHFAAFMHRAMNHDPNFEAGSISKERKLRTSGKKYTDTGLIIDYYNSSLDVPLPSGETFQSIQEKQEKKRFEILVKENHTGSGSSRILTSTTNSLKEEISNTSEFYGITEQEYIDIINWAIETGEVYDGGNFSLFYGFQSGLLYTSAKRLD